MENITEFTPDKIAEIDLLGRENLVKTICRKITHYPYKDCLTIGICGSWGCGKSTMLDQIKKELEKEADSLRKPIIVKFNPWNYNNASQLIYMFFKELEISLFKEEIENKNEIKKLFNSLTLILAPMIVIAEKFAEKRVWIILAILQSIVAYYRTTAKEKSLHKIKTDLNEKISNMSRKIIVMIDDIDRLDSESIKIIFRLIRLNADFDNMIYIVAIDREAVEKALQEVQKIDGRKYLEKIIQVSFDIPVPELDQLYRILNERRNELFAQIGISEDKFDKKRFKQIEPIFNSHFQNIRDIIRYLNGVKITLPEIQKEVNLEDFLIIELIRTFYIDVYNLIQNESDYFLSHKTDLGDELYNWIKSLNESSLDSKRKEIKEALENILPKNNLGKNLLTEMLQFLFPKIDFAFSQKYKEWSKSEELENALRICSESKFYNYFLLRVPLTRVNSIELNKIIDNIEDNDFIQKKLNDLLMRNALTDYITSLSRSTKNVDANKIEAGFINLINNSDIILQEPKKHIFDCEYYYNTIISNLYQNLHQQTIKELLTNSELKPSRLYFLSYLIDHIESPKEGNDIFKEHKKIITDRINQGFEQDLFDSKIYYRRLLPFWNAWSKNKEAQEYIKKITSDDKGICNFLTHMRHEKPPSLNSTPVLDRELIKTFFDLDNLKKRVMLIKDQNPDWLNNEHLEVIKLLLTDRFN